MVFCPVLLPLKTPTDIISKHELLGSIVLCHPQPSLRLDVLPEQQDAGPNGPYTWAFLPI